MTVTVPDARAWTPEEARDPAAVVRKLAARGVRFETEEIGLLADLLGRPPRWAEAVLFGILWSEHCSYKSTRHLLRRLPTRAPQVILGPGEDAGVVSLPAPCEDLALVLAHESHNHPSQVLPVEGAATGVGGIVRDVGCMGAEVIGVLDALRFGDPLADGVGARDIVRGVVRGIADYGNALGVPNLGGDVVFDHGFASNCLVNVMSAGLVPRDGILRSRVPEGPGPWVFVLVGKPTDESGFGGASFASGELGEGDQRGAVQLPDPFLKRVLHVANGEMFRRIRGRGIPAGFKDLGAGGIACATSELAAAGGRGADVVLDDAHVVARPLPPEVLLCAETQERFCWVVPESFAEEACDVYNRDFELGAVYPGAGARVIGRATEGGVYRVTWRGETLVECSVEAITAGRRAMRAARRRAPAAPLARRGGRRGPGLHDGLRRVLGSWNGCSREYLFRHYDSEVQGRTWLRPGEGDATIVRALPERPTGIGFAVGGNPAWCAADPELGARHAVAEAARNLACTGARPWALTDCLNYGHPQDAAVMGDLEASLEGLAVAAEALGGLAAPGHPLPYVSGNVSLYNQVGEQAIPPSPIVMAAGVLHDVTTATGIALRGPGHFLVLAGDARSTLTGSLYARDVLGVRDTAPPPLDLQRERRLQELAVLAAEGRWVVAAHDVSDGGLGAALAEMLLAAPARVGADVDLAVLEADPDVALFSEEPAIVFEVPAEGATRLFAAARERGLEAWPIGTVAAHGELRLLLPGGARETWTREVLEQAVRAPLPALWNEEVS